jgi:hypothetical protein
MAAFVLVAAGASTIEPEEIDRAIGIAESSQTNAIAVGVEVLPSDEEPILSVELEDGTEVDVDTSTWEVIRTARPLFARRQRRVGRAVGDIGAQRISLSAVYRNVLQNAANAAVSAESVRSVQYVIHRRRLVVLLTFGSEEDKGVIYADPRTGELLDVAWYLDDASLRTT